MKNINPVEAAKYALKQSTNGVLSENVLNWYYSKVTTGVWSKSDYDKFLDVIVDDNFSRFEKVFKSKTSMLYLNKLNYKLKSLELSIEEL